MKPGLRQRIATLVGVCLLAIAPVTAAAQDYLATSVAVTGVLQKPLNRAQRAQILAALEQACRAGGKWRVGDLQPDRRATHPAGADSRSVRLAARGGGDALRGCVKSRPRVPGQDGVAAPDQLLRWVPALLPGASLDRSGLMGPITQAPFMKACHHPALSVWQRLRDPAAARLRVC